MIKEQRKVNFTRTISIPITQKIYEELKEQSKLYGVTISAVVRKVLNKYFKETTHYEETGE